MRFADDQKASSESAVESRSGSSKPVEEAEARRGGYARTNQSGCRAPTSAVLGRFHAPLTAQVPPMRPLRPVYPLRTRCRPMGPLRPCSHSRPRSPPHHRQPPLTDSASVALRPRHECARSAATAPVGRPLMRPALPLRCSTRPPRPRSCLHRVASGGCVSTVAYSAQ